MAGRRRQSRHAGGEALRLPVSRYGFVNMLLCRLSLMNGTGRYEHTTASPLAALSALKNSGAASTGEANVSAVMEKCHVMTARTCHITYNVIGVGNDMPCCYRTTAATPRHVALRPRYTKRYALRLYMSDIQQSSRDSGGYTSPATRKIWQMMVTGDEEITVARGIYVHNSLRSGYGEELTDERRTNVQESVRYVYSVVVDGKARHGRRCGNSSSSA